jgi:hypothetical protein
VTYNAHVIDEQPPFFAEPKDDVIPYEARFQRPLGSVLSIKFNMS